MFNGYIYDGRYNLDSDFVAFIDEAVGSSSDKPFDDRMASFYGISLEEYHRGQQWAQFNLSRVRREAGIGKEPKGTVHLTYSMEPKPAAKPQPADVAPAQPAPRRNAHRHKASMVAHRTRR